MAESHNNIDHRSFCHRDESDASAVRPGHASSRPARSEREASEAPNCSLKHGSKSSKVGAHNAIGSRGGNEGKAADAAAKELTLMAGI